MSPLRPQLLLPLLAAPLALGAQPAAQRAAADRPAAAAPAPTGTIEGRVTTPAGAPLADVMVVVQAGPAGAPRGTMTDDAGRFALPAAPAGTYTLVAKRVGLAAQTRTVILDGAAAHVAFTLAEQATVVAPVVVSASRERQRRAEASATIDALTGSDVRLARAAHPAQVMKRIPGVYVSQLSGEGHSMAIRQPITTKPMYLYLEDGVPTRATGFFNHNALYEVNLPQAGGIEVLKGPGTAIYGSDAIGGVVNVLTRPAPASPSGDVSTEGGAFGYARLLASGGTTHGRDGVRADLNLTRMDGWRSASAYDRQSGTVRWDHFGNDGLTVRSTVTGTRVDQQDASAVSAAQLWSGSPFNRGPIAFRGVRALRATTAIEKTSGATSVGLTPYARYNVLDLLPYWQLDGDPQVYTTRSTSVGLLARARRDFAPLRTRVAIGADLDLTPGGYHANQIAVDTAGTGAAKLFRGYATGRRLYDYDVTYRQASPYAQLELSPVQKLRLDAGARWDVTGYTYRTKLAPIQTGNWRIPGDTALTYQRLSPKLGLTYEASERLSAFASWRSGFRAPSQGQLFTQGRADSTTSLRPVTVQSWETGVRGQLGRAFLYSVSAYDMTIRNDIVTFTTADNFRIAANAGQTRHRGLETSVSAMVRPSLRVDVAYSVSAQRYVTWQPQAARAARPAADGRPAVTAAPAISYAGRDIEGAPRDLANGVVTWTPGFLRGGRLAAEWSHTGRYVAGYRVNAANQPTDAVPYGGHELFTLHANAMLTPRVEAFGRVTNLLDRRYAEVAQYTAANRAQPDQLFPGAPRAVYAGLRYAWSR